jgi:dipeptidyl aminopeptidase/acylaminoacyl peptidase
MANMKPFEVDDIYLHHSITSLDVAPSRRVAACTVVSHDRDKDGRRSAIWAVPYGDADGSSGQTPHQLTSGTDSDSDAKWSPDGAQLAFLSNRAGTSQIFLRSELTGDSLRVSDLPGSVVAFEWSPSGQQMLVTAAVTVNPEARGGPGRDQSSPPGPMLAWRLPYKSDGVGFMLAREIHLYVFDVASHESKRITHGAFDVMGAAWSHDGTKIVYSRTRDGRFAHCTDLWMCDADGSNERQLTRTTAATQPPFCSPDGKWIAFSGAEEEGDARSSLWLYDIRSGDVRSLGGPDIEVVVGEAIRWSPDSESIYVVLAHRGCQKAARVSIADGDVQWIVSGPRHISHVTLADDRLLFLAEAPLDPIEMFSTGLDGNDERCHTTFNAWSAGRAKGTAAIRAFDVPDGRGGTEKVEGWLLTPPGAAKPLPLVVDAHGGPASYALLKFESQAYVPMLLSRGFAVLALNPVGSSSYGREFSDRLRGRWGEIDLPQQMAAVEALQAEGLVDERVAIVGKSYGGYLAALAMGTTDRFVASVVIAPVGNLETHYGTSDGGYYADEYSMKARPGQGDTYRRLSPIDKVANIKTPTLFLQGADDERCPKCQSEELFVCIMRYTQTPAELVLYPGVGHMFTSMAQPSFRKDAFTRILDWVTRWCEAPHQAQDEVAEAPV